ncbi:hypothetical protein Tco_0151193 [Tanacetum coccineum]
MENYAPLPQKEMVRAALATLGLVDKNNHKLSSTELINSSPLRIRYFSATWKHGVQSKAITDKKSKKKINPPSSKPKTSKIVKESSPSKQVIDTQHAKELVTTADATKGLDASESAEEQENQPKTIDAEKKEDDDEFTDSGIKSLGNVTFKEMYGNTKESPYDTESEIKVVKRFNL